MKINIKKLQEGGNIPTFSLPEINVYPSNRWGDIARSQGLETARNWRAVKEGTTSGINEFANDPRTQAVMALLPISTEDTMLKAAKNAELSRYLWRTKFFIDDFIKTPINDKIITPLTDFAKNTYNKYTAPKTNLKIKPFKGDNLELQKMRLKNGGYEKLGISDHDVEIPLDHPLSNLGTVSNNITVFSNPTLKINSKKFLENLSPIIDKSNSKTWNNAYYTKLDKKIYSPTKGDFLIMNEKYPGSVDAHEFYHAIDDIKDKNYNKINSMFNSMFKNNNSLIDIPGYDKNKIPFNVNNYFTTSKGSELNARLAQLKNYFGLTNAYDEITPEMWNYARRHYTSDMGFDNNMQHMFRAVTNPEKFLKWINPRVASTTGVILGTQQLNDK